MRILIWVIKAERVIESLRWATLRAISIFLSIILTYSTRDFDTYQHVRARAAKSDFLATVSHIMKFSKDIVLKSDARISHNKMLFLQPHFSF